MNIENTNSLSNSIFYDNNYFEEQPPKKASTLKKIQVIFSGKK